MPPIDSREIDSAQMLFGSLIKLQLDRKICQSCATRFSFVHKFVKDKSLNEEESFSGDLQPTGRTLGFIGKEFNKFFENIDEPYSQKLYLPIYNSLVSFYVNSYNPIIKFEENKEKDESEEENRMEITCQMCQTASALWRCKEDCGCNGELAWI